MGVIAIFSSGFRHFQVGPGIKKSQAGYVI